MLSAVVTAKAQENCGFPGVAPGRVCPVTANPGLMTPYWKVVRGAQATIVVIQDTPENILERIVFFDIDSQPIPRTPLSAANRRYYLREIKADISYFRRSYAKATLSVDIAGADAEAAARRIRLALTTI